MSKKAAKPQVKEQSYELRDVVLAKVRGFPPWPGIVVDPESVPKTVKKERPNAKAKKGNWYCVRFFPAGDYAWIVPKDISKLQRHEIEAYIAEPYKRSGDLLQGYRIALDPTEWEQNIQAKQEEAAEEEANAEVDQLQSDAEDPAEDEDEEKKVKSKKRKRETDAVPAKPKAAKQPKAKKEKEAPAPKKKPTSTVRGKKNGIKSKATVESEDEGAADAEETEDAGPSAKASSPPTKKQKRDKEDEDVDPAMAKDPEANKVRDWRHKLQKAFLSKTVPTDEDMPGLNALFTTVEQYENMSIGYLTFSKIGKVMRHIHALTPDKVPRDEEFKFRERAKSLVDKWHDILNANKPNGDAPVRKPSTNGKAHTEDAGENGKEESPEATKADGDTMDIDAKAENEIEATSASAPALTSEPAPEKSSVDTSADADADASAEVDAPAEPEDAPAETDTAAKEETAAVQPSEQPDVAMSEATTA